MDDFSPWDWADTFLLHEAACLIAGVPVVPKVTIVLEELPTNARPILKQLMIAWAIGERQRKSPDASFPNERTLQALPSDGTGHCLSTMFARDELHRWVREMGRKSAYSFEPVGVVEHVPVVDSRTVEQGAPLPAATPAPVAAASNDPAPLQAVPNWKMQIQAEATAHVQRLRKLGCSPTRHSILDDMAKWCHDHNVMTDGGIFPSANYLRTHVLGGKYWDVPK